MTNHGNDVNFQKKVQAFANSYTNVHMFHAIFGLSKYFCFDSFINYFIFNRLQSFACDAVQTNNKKVEPRMKCLTLIAAFCIMSCVLFMAFSIFGFIFDDKRATHTHIKNPGKCCALHLNYPQIYWIKCVAENAYCALNDEHWWASHIQSHEWNKQKKSELKDETREFKAIKIDTCISS